MNTMLATEKLTKTFRAKIKEPGLSGSLRAIRHPHYREIAAVDGIDLEVEKGELLAFLGPNGAGKSTTIKMLTGILTPTSGSMTVAGLTPGKDQRALAYRIGSVFGQKSMLYWHLPALDSFRLLGAIYDVDGIVLQKRLDALVELLEIGEYLKTPVRKLSLGERMRCEVAASLLHRPEILFLDEPTIGLDVVVKAKIREMIRRINREEGVTVFLTSHDIGDVEQLCRRAVIINHGRTVLDSTISEIKRSYLRKKIIRVQYVTSIDRESLSGFTILQCKDNEAVLEVDALSNSMHGTMARIMAVGEVADVTISDMPMEEIISAIFQQESGGSGSQAG
jgi:ABC-2 type transport system ATP-binding protein